MNEYASTRAFTAFLVRKQSELGEDLGRVPIAAERLSAGWAFYYQSRAYLETGNSDDRLIGHGPVVVRDDGTVIEGGSLDWQPETLLLR